MAFPKVGSKAPDFVCNNENGEPIRLKDYKGKKLVLYFYPKDDTPGCTIEACALRDNLPKFKEIGAVVLGISSDSAKSHKSFAEKHGLPFTLLADEERKTIEAYEVGGGFLCGAKRTSFIINPNGEIVKIYEGVKPEVHAQEVLEDLKKFKK